MGDGLFKLIMNKLFDGRGQYKGRIVEDSDGSKIFDENGRYCGKYVESSDRTFDANGRVYGNGNQLNGLLED